MVPVLSIRWCQMCVPRALRGARDRRCCAEREPFVIPCRAVLTGADRATLGAASMLRCRDRAGWHRLDRGRGGVSRWGPAVRQAQAAGGTVITIAAVTRARGRSPAGPVPPTPIRASGGRHLPSRRQRGRSGRVSPWLSASSRPSGGACGGGRPVAGQRPDLLPRAAMPDHDRPGGTTDPLEEPRQWCRWRARPRSRVMATFVLRMASVRVDHPL